MDMHQPARRNAIDENRNGLIGAPLDRVDGRAKVTGQAVYAHEAQDGPQALYGVIVGATVARGVLEQIDTAAAEAASGVRLVLTHRNAPAQGAWGPVDAEDRYARADPQLAGTQIAHYGQAVAFVVADSFEQARAAALLIALRLRVLPGAFELQAHLAAAETPDSLFGAAPDTQRGDAEQAFARAAVRVDARYTTPVHIHAQMEPHAALAHWPDGPDGRLVVHCAAQLLDSAKQAVARTLQIAPERVRIVSPYIGGGFGGKLPVFGEVMLSALAARQLGRPVKTALTRQQMFHATTHRSETVQRVRLGADRTGRLQAIAHDTIAHTARRDNFMENAGQQTRSLYAAPHCATTHRYVKLDLPLADSTRAPGEAVGLLALEQAMDELADQLGMDPVDLRLRNDTQTDPEQGVPFSTRQLAACLREGAQRFGWAQRATRPLARVEGRWAIGMGMAAAVRSNLLMASHCALTLDRTGLLTVRLAMTDIGTGSYTVLTQIAAEMLGLAPAQVRMQMGDSDLPKTPGSGGSWGAASAGSGLFDACTQLRALLARRLGVPGAQAVFADGQVSGAGKTAALGALAGPLGLQASGEIQPGAMAKRYAQQAYGAHFAETAVHLDTGEIRLRRMLGVFAAGRILNLKTATSQALGGMVWGVGGALHEEALIDPRFGYFANHDLAGYHVPCHADIPAIAVHFLPEVDDKANPLKIKGVGELGICGSGAAVANAVFNACGVRVRDFPLTVDKVLAGLRGAAG